MTKYSTFNVVIFTFIFAMLTACKKEKADKEPDPVGYYIKFKVDGVQKQFTYSEGVKFRSNYASNLMYIEVREDIDLYPHIQFQFSNTKMIFNKNLIITNKISSDTLGYMLYNEGNNYLNEYRTLDPKAAKFGNTDFVFSLTDRTDSHVSGTFSGTGYNFKDGVQTKKIITEGKFYLNKGL